MGEFGENLVILFIIIYFLVILTRRDFPANASICVVRGANNRFISGSLIFGNVYIILSNVNDFSNNNSKFIDVCGV